MRVRDQFAYSKLGHLHAYDATSQIRLHILLLIIVFYEMHGDFG